MTTTKPAAINTPEPISLGELTPNLQLEFGDGPPQPKIGDPLNAPDPGYVAQLVPELAGAAAELCELRAEAARTRSSYEQMFSPAGREADELAAAVGPDLGALASRPRRLAEARLAAAQASAKHMAGLARWQWILEDCDLPAALRARMSERPDAPDLVATLDRLAPAVEVLDQLTATKDWLEQHRQAPRMVTSAPARSTDTLAGLLSDIRHALADALR